MTKKKKTNKKNKKNKEIKEIKVKEKESFITYYILISCITILIFGFIYGIKILTPTYTNWIFASTGDIFQHYVGWEAFRAGTWNFPIGLTNTISYPTNISVIYTDAIPLFAIFFKLISFALPKTFQYLGLYGLLCFILQAILSTHIIKNYTDSKANIIITSMLFTIIPSMIFRMFYHTALASQWLLLISLETIFLYNNYKEGRKIYYIWAIIAFLIGTIHAYYLVMCGIILVGYIILDILNTKKIKKSILLLLTFLSTAVTTIWLFGGFTNTGKNDSFGFGSYSFNLNGLINSQGWSIFLKQMPMQYNQYEGFSYLGMGVIILIIIATILTVIWFKKDKEDLKQHKNITISLLIITILSVFVALSPKAYLGNTLLYDLKLPDFITNIWSIFRSTGRFVWPVIYILMLSSIIIILKRLNWKYSLLILSICTFIQIIDIGSILKEKNEFYTNDFTINQEYNISNFELLNNAINNNKIKLLILASENFYDTDKMLYADWALNNHLKTNRMHFARTSFDKTLNKNTKKLLKDKDDTKLFIFTTNNECTSNHLHCYKLPNNHYIGYINELY